MHGRLGTSLLIASLSLAAVVSGCESLLGFEGLTRTPASDGERFPDVIAVELRPLGEDRYDVVVTLSSPYDSPERYADGWRVIDGAGAVLGTHTLLHHHAAEQPFTRTQMGLHIPSDVTEVTVEGRDQANGFGGSSLTVRVPRE